MKKSAWFTFGLILGLAVAPALAATMTITVPDAILNRVIDAWSIGQGWTSESELTKAQFARAKIRDVIRQQVISYESRGAGNTAGGQAATDTEGMAVN